MLGVYSSSYVATIYKTKEKTEKNVLLLDLLSLHLQIWCRFVLYGRLKPMTLKFGTGGDE